MAVFDDGVSNPTTNPDFNDILDERLSRRSMLGAGAAVAAVGFLGGGLLDASPAQAGVATRRPGTWTPVAPSVDDVVVVPDGYVAEPVYKWGQPIVPSGPAFDGPFNTAAEQEQQAGSEHDGMYYFPLDRRNRRGLLAMNHEASDQNFILPGGPDGNGGWSLEKARKSQSAHGVSVIEISAESGSWQVVESPYARRVTVNTPVEFSGPAANDPRIVGASGLGTVNNCANGWTPWGTYLTCEENINGYFGWDPASGYTPPTDLTRYTFTAAGFGYRWWEVDERFDPSKTPNEPYNFGWVVEIDPFDPDSAPVKRTALGRFKHENAALTEGRGNRAVVYMGDDERGEYIYKFVSDRSWRGSPSPRPEPVRQRHVVRRDVQGRRDGGVAAPGPRLGRADGGQRVRGPGRCVDPGPAGGRRRRRDPDGPAGVGGRPPADRRGILHPHEQHQPRLGELPEPAG